MKIVDINLLIYAINKDAPHHSKAKKSPLMGDPYVFVDSVNDWLQQPPSLTIVPSHQHWSIFKELLMPLGVAANLTSDAHLAALAIEHGARLYSTDIDFSRFQSLRWTNPIE